MTQARNRRQPRPQVKDRIIQIQRKSIVRDAFGSAVVSWVDHLPPQWASFTPLRGTETFVSKADRLLATRFGTWGISYSVDKVDETMRLRDGDGREWAIVGIAQVGHRRGLDLQCKSTGPNAPARPHG